MGLDVASCCRLCLGVAASESAAHVDVQQQPELGTIIEELYGLNLCSGGRGSRLICLVCYKKVVDLKRHLNGLDTKAKLVSINQAILEGQRDAFPEPAPKEDVKVRCDWLISEYQPPSGKATGFLLHVEDCMRSPRFQERFHDHYDLLHLRISGPTYQHATGEFLDVWYPEQIFCNKCATVFEIRDAFDEHYSRCKFKCLFCKRVYTFVESLHSHSCPKRSNYSKLKRKQWESYQMVPIAKRIRVDNGDTTGPPLSVRKDLNSNGLELIPALPAPTIEGEASLDLELNNLLERWYGQNEELEELTNLNLEAIEGSSTASNINVYDSSFQKQVIAPKPAISVKPISQLVATPIAQRMAQQTPQSSRTANPTSDVIEIDDDDDNNLRRQGTVGPRSIQLLNKQDQQSLSQADVLNIVKHFRGIDENESYLIKAKINGASKLICVSKRKGEAGSSATIVNSNTTAAPRPAPIAPRPVPIAPRPVPTVTRPVSITPAAQTTVGQNSSIASTVTSTAVTRNYPNRQATVPPKVIHKTTINGRPMTMGILENALHQQPPNVANAVPNVPGRHSTPAPLPQLKIAHVESLVGQHSKPPQRILNGLKPSEVRATRHQPSSITASASTSSPRRIIVGSSSINLMGSTDQSRGIATMAPQPVASRPAPPLANLTSTQQRIVVKRKQIKTVVQSTIRQSIGNTNAFRTVTSSPGGVPAAGPPPLVRRPSISQQVAPKIYPSSLGNSGAQPTATGYRPILPNVSKPEISVMDSSGVRYKLSNTTIKRVG